MLGPAWAVISYFFLLSRGEKEIKREKKREKREYKREKESTREHKREKKRERENAAGGIRTPASFHAWLLECTSEHQPDSSRPLCLDKYPSELPVLSCLLLACGETLWETIGEHIGEPLGGIPRGTLGETLREPLGEHLREPLGEPLWETLGKPYGKL